MTAGFTQVPIQKLLSGFLSSYEDADTELGIMMPAIIVKAFDVKVRPVVVLIKGNLIMTVHEGDVNRIMKFARYAPTFIKKIKADSTADRITRHPGAHHRREQRPELRVPARDREARGRHQQAADRRRPG